MTVTSVSTTTAIPGYQEGTWDIDPVHSDVSFTVRHMMVSKVRGRFSTFSGTFTTGEQPERSSLEATVDLTSIDTNNAQRDEHIRSADFFGTDEHPTLSYRSSAVRPAGDGWMVDGELTLHGVTRPVALALEVNGFAPDAFGGERAGFTATTTIDRRDFGISYNMPIEAGGVVIGDKIAVTIEVEAVLRAPEA